MENTLVITIIAALLCVAGALFFLLVLAPRRSPQAVADFKQPVERIKDALSKERERSVIARRVQDVSFGHIFAGLFIIALFAFVFGADQSVIANTADRVFHFAGRKLVGIPCESLVALAFVAVSFVAGHLVLEAIGTSHSWFKNLESRKQMRVLLAVSGIMLLAMIVLAQWHSVRPALVSFAKKPNGDLLLGDNGKPILNQPTEEQVTAARLIIAVTTLGGALMGLASDIVLGAAQTLAIIPFNFCLSIKEGFLQVGEALCELVISLITYRKRVREHTLEDRDHQRSEENYFAAVRYLKGKENLTPMDRISLDRLLGDLEKRDLRDEDYGLVKLWADALDMAAGSPDFPAACRRALTYFSLEELRLMRGPLMQAVLTNDHDALANAIESLARFSMIKDREAVEKASRRSNALKNVRIKVGFETFDQLTDPRITDDATFLAAVTNLETAAERVSQKVANVVANNPDLLDGNTGLVKSEVALLASTQFEGSVNHLYIALGWLQNMKAEGKSPFEMGKLRQILEYVGTDERAHRTAININRINTFVSSYQGSGASTRTVAELLAMTKGDLAAALDELN